MIFVEGMRTEEDRFRRALMSANPCVIHRCLPLNILKTMCRIT